MAEKKERKFHKLADDQLDGTVGAGPPGRGTLERNNNLKEEDRK